MSSDDVLDVLTRHIEAEFELPLGHLLQDAVAIGRAHPATEVLRWYGLTAEAEAVVEQAEDTLLAAIGPAPGKLAPSQMVIAHQVNTAVAARDGRAMVLRRLINDKERQVWRGARPQSRVTAQVSAAMPPRPPVNAVRAAGR
ncbi:hypothetical protein OTB20_36175 [Streptomyces sp. H27-H1]|uniref:hypothetical protein n=1 Tax=Streptomyces sp. H27-H1 TaxID=2996461 RepID=UPI00226EE369|nr:hypothetical protein [Streptomyces sp. H27-H1]MCY0931530.1 hypothetical protein [Streptomyces sp. H27-H1]